MSDKAKGFITVFCLILAVVGMACLSIFGVTYNDKTYFSYKNIKQGLDLKGGVYIVYEADNPQEDDMKKAESIVRLRLDNKNYMEATVSIQGTNRLRVEIPDVENAESAVEDIGKTAMLMFIDEDENIVVSGSEIVDASYQEYPEVVGGVEVRKPGVSVTFSKEGTAKFSAATANNIGRMIYIVLDGTIISAPTVQQQINTNICSITGEFTMEEADNLAMLIKSGALPVPLEIIEMNKVGAQLGSDALAGSITAGCIGTALIMLFMFAVYRMSGLMADIALCFFIAAVLILLSLFKVTLTLPGIAGIILTIAMAVDANVIIFERMKDELRVGKTIRTAIETGFSRALPAIVDVNITSLITGFILFFLGTGPIKGFAQTLILGVLMSFLTAIVVTRALLFGFYRMGVKSRWLYGARKEAKQ